MQRSVNTRTYIIPICLNVTAFTWSGFRDEMETRGFCVLKKSRFKNDFAYNELDKDVII